MRLRNTTGLTALLVALAMVMGCGGPATDTADQNASAPTETKTAHLVYVNWAEGVAYTHLAKVILEDELGYEVTITAADVAPAYAAVAQGDQDAFMETWLPVLHKDYVDKFGDRVVDLGHVYEGTRSGIVVPAYVPIDKISQLPAAAEQLDGKITGIDAGAGIMKTTEQVIEQYGLDLELISSSGPAMSAALKKAIDDEEWIAVTGWKPHWMFGRWDLKFLDQDEDKIVWKTGNIHIMGRQGLREEKQELARFLSSYFFTDEQLSDLMLAMRDADDREAAAREWMNAHPDLVAGWIS
ncbi:MAG: glycine betaine ABC transporter substrate-binding protein [Acidobacteriota bacterium]|nr:glycine betaine ABC transporter substrate-binding protein [Acidobacteriota bacterium]